MIKKLVSSGIYIEEYCSEPTTTMMLCSMLLLKLESAATMTYHQLRTLSCEGSVLACCVPCGQEAPLSAAFSIGDAGKSDQQIRVAPLASRTL